MKLFKIRSNQIVQTLFFLMILCSCSSSGGKKGEQQNLGTQIDFFSPLSTCLYGKKASEFQGGVELAPGDFVSWEGNGALSWEVEIPEKDEYEVYVIANVGLEGNGTKIVFKTKNEEYEFSLSPTSGPFPGGENFQVKEIKNFQRIKLSGVVNLEAGKQKITILTSGIEKEGVLFDFRSAELLPLSKKAEIANEEARAKEARASVDWLMEAGYGLMFHWTSQSVQPDGSIKKYEDAVNEFDVGKFANMVEETGAGYVLFTIGHAESYCPAPLKSWERIHPGHTTQRDLIEEIANALNKKEVRLLCYLNGPLAFKFARDEMPGDLENQAFVANFTDILTEMGNRYQDKIAGYWFDSWYRIFEGFQAVPFEAFYKATKIGNKDRIICLNPWIYPDVTPWQDYWSGEIQQPIEIPENGFMKNGSSPNLPYQALLTMEKHLWVQKKAEIMDPKYNSEQLSTYIKDCMDNGGAVTINLAIYQDGTVGEKALQVMKEVKDQIRYLSRN
jgi:hypothetical protein